MHQQRFTREPERLFKKIILLVAIIFVSSPAAQAQDTGLQELITKKDASFWKAYNTCDIAGMEKHLSEDLEFYHDKGGITYGRKDLSDDLRQGLCKSGKNYLRREAVPGSVSIYPLKDKDSVYGAIITGEHLFYIIEEDSEKLDGQAKFSHLWLKEPGDWKMHRVYSFDHGPATFGISKQVVELPKEKLLELTGQYLTDSKDPITVLFDGGNLELRALGKTFILYPEDEHTFFTKDRDLSFSFNNEDPRTLTIYESDNKVEEATFHQK